MVTAPRFDPLRLSDLDPGDLAVLEKRAVIEGVRFEVTSFEQADLTDAVLIECLLDRVTLVDVQLRGARFSESELVALNAPVLAAARSIWRDVVVRGSRIGSAELFEAQFSGTRILSSKLGYVNLRGAKLDNVEISGCTIDELDLGGVQAKRVAIVDCQIGTLDVTRAKLSNVDLRGTTFDTIVGLEGLRGATIDEAQLAALAPFLAESAGLSVQ